MMFNQWETHYIVDESGIYLCRIPDGREFILRDGFWHDLNPPSENGENLYTPVLAYFWIGEGWYDSVDEKDVPVPFDESLVISD